MFSRLIGICAIQRQKYRDVSVLSIAAVVTVIKIYSKICYFGHLDFYRRAMEQKLKYAVAFEDNGIVKSKELYA